MRFASPGLGLVCAVVAAVVAVIWLLATRRQRRSVLQFSDMRLVAQAAPRRAPRRRVALGVAVTAAAVAGALGAAQPQIRGEADSETGRVVLVMDTSGSMRSEDVAPTRLEAARQAADAFASAAPDGVEIAIVSFASGALPVLTPTTDRDAVTVALGELVADGGTATGEGMYAGMSMLETDGWVDGIDGGVQRRIGAMVLLTDGETNAGRDPLVAAELAAESGVVINTVAFGTADGNIDGQPVGVDVALMEQIAELTGGTSAQATTSADLVGVFSDLGRSTRVVYGWQSVAHWFAAMAVVLLGIGVAFGVPRSGRLS